MIQATAGSDRVLALPPIVVTASDWTTTRFTAIVEAGAHRPAGSPGLGRSGGHAVLRVMRFGSTCVAIARGVQRGHLRWLVKLVVDDKPYAIASPRVQALRLSITVRAGPVPVRDQQRRGRARKGPGHDPTGL